MEAADRSLHRPRHPMTIAQRTAFKTERLGELGGRIKAILKTQRRAPRPSNY